MEKKISRSLDPSFTTLQKRVDQTKVAYVDETSFRQEAKNCYVWTATTDQETLLRILPTRGLKSLDEIRPRSHPGITVTDRYSVYKYKRHQYCLAHLYRDFKKFSQRDGPDKEFGSRALFEIDEIFRILRLGCRKTIQGRVKLSEEETQRYPLRCLCKWIG